MANVVPFQPDGVIPATVMEPNEELIVALENMLIDARSGHLRAVGYVLIDRDRAIHTGWTGKADRHDMTAGVNMLAYRYMASSQED